MAEEHNRVVQVTGNLRALVDRRRAGRCAATLTGLRPAGRRPSTNADIEALRADGALTGEETYKPSSSRSSVIGSVTSTPTSTPTTYTLRCTPC